MSSSSRRANAVCRIKEIPLLVESYCRKYLGSGQRGIVESQTYKFDENGNYAYSQYLVVPCDDDGRRLPSNGDGGAYGNQFVVCDTYEDARKKCRELYMKNRTPHLVIGVDDDGNEQKLFEYSHGDAPYRTTEGLPGADYSNMLLKKYDPAEIIGFIKWMQRQGYLPSETLYRMKDDVENSNRSGFANGMRSSFVKDMFRYLFDLELGEPTYKPYGI